MLSSLLGRADKEKIAFLHKCQLRTREKLRVILNFLYENVDLGRELEEQSAVFGVGTTCSTSRLMIFRSLLMNNKE